MEEKSETGLARLLRPFAWARRIVYVVILAALWLALNANAVTDFLAARIQRNENKRSVIELEREFSELSDEKRALESGGFPAEKAIRERFKMIRPGERIIVLESPPEPLSKARIDSSQP